MSIADAYDSRLKTWIRRFNGIATKYLDNYLGWHRLLERYRDRISPAVLHDHAVRLFKSVGVWPESADFRLPFP